MKISNLKNRLGIFAYYDEIPGIKEYVSYLLNEIKNVVSELIVVVNGEIAEADLRTMKEYTTKVYRRENRGFDGAAYRQIICEVLGQEKLYEYGQVVLVNNSFYGPFVSMVDIFEKMEKQQLDFWGINSFFREGIRPYVESYFLVVESRMLHNQDFWDFWVKLDTDVEVLAEIAHNFEREFTWYFADRGYQWNVYTDKTEEMRKGEALNIYCNPYSAIQKIHLPILKRKAFEQSKIRKCICNETARTLDYLHYETYYNIDYILKDIRTRYGKELRLNYDYIIDTQGKIYGHENEAALICIAHMENVGYIQKKLLEDLIGCDYYILVQSGEEKYIEHLNIYSFRDQNYGVKLIKNISEKYRYICYIQDRLHYSEESLLLPQMEIDYIFANLLGNNTYINKIIEVLEQKGYLKGIFWKQGKNMFWIRSQLMSDILRLIEMREDWIEYLGECAIAYIEENDGLWGTVMCAESAAVEIAKHTYELNCICRRFGFNSVDRLMAREYKLDEVVKFCKMNDVVYIYGAGTYARHIVEELFFRGITIQGILVSDGQPKEDNLYIYPIYYLSEIEITSETGVVIAANWRKEIRQNLQEKGCKKILAVT